MLRKSSLIAALLLIFCSHNVFAQDINISREFNRDSIINAMYRANNYFLENQWREVDRNWVRGTYYTGLMAFYSIFPDSVLLEQATNWASKHGWRTGSEWIYPANRMTCVQTYLQLYFIDPNENKIENARDFMDSRKDSREPASHQGWDYVDALYVGTPAYFMMSIATSDTSYAYYANWMFQDVYRDLFDREDHLFYRDEKAKKEKSPAGNKIFWSRGNGWAIAAIPRILEYYPESFKGRQFYIEILQQMANSLADRQGDNGYWPVNLGDPSHFPGPESSGTAFFTYAIAWGINNGYLNKEEYSPVLIRAWNALYNSVDKDGMVQWGQTVARKPEAVDNSDWDEFVSGAFLLAGSEVFKFCREWNADDAD